MSCPMGFGARKPCDRGENSGLRADGEEDDKSRSFYDSSLQTGFVSFHVECDENFNISGCDFEACKALKAHEKSLVGRSITSLMSPMIAKFHDRYFRTLRTCPPEKFDAYRVQIERTMTKANHFVVYDCERNAMMCEVQVALYDNLSSMVTFTVRSGEGCPMVDSVPRNYLPYINRDPGLYVNNYDDVTCIMMDLANSTAFCVNNSPRNTASVYYDVHRIAKEVVLEVYPFVYIHELIGDAVFLVVNASFMVKNPERPAFLAMHVATTIQQQLEEMLVKKYNSTMRVRAGIACGSVCAGVIDGRSFRMFGSTVHLAQRLESLCPIGSVCIDEATRHMLSLQSPDDDFKAVLDGLIEDCNSHIKGFGTMDYFAVRTPSTVPWYSALISQSGLIDFEQDKSELPEDLDDSLCNRVPTVMSLDQSR
mmetsp:Transcript_39399/g.75484  ORF Transcript_39399/g.75484 Transcript_39399/m.75484 type:complete len:423 (-) Transcript_39399:115-1383(-)